jgi:hypothetical protein
MNINPKRDAHILPILQWVKDNNNHEQGARFKSNLLSEQGADPSVFKVPDNFNGRDYITMLLHIDAEIEHGLMLQYLYAAYSIGGPHIPEQYKEKVRSWQEIITGIAKEEMGHFISVQNVLKIIGAPLNFGRESYPWDIPFYPFPFTLEKFTLGSLAKYVYAEAPSDWLNSEDPLAKEIKKKVGEEVKDPKTVGALFKVILQLIQDPNVIPDEAFQPESYPFQAKFEEWGRGYTGGARGATSVEKFKASPDVLVVPLMSRDDAYKALDKIAEQGEGEGEQDDETSHFQRFLHIYKELREIQIQDPSFDPSRQVANNPYIVEQPDHVSPAEDMESVQKSDAITNPVSILWSKLFDIRYRMLLNYLNHSFLLDNGYNFSGNKAPRGMIINSTFGEMYNLRSLANILVQSPRGVKPDGKVAGPTFTIPYTMELPFGEHNRWRMHKDLVIAAQKLIVELKTKGTPFETYLNSLMETDQKFLESVNELTEVNA